MYKPTIKMYCIIYAILMLLNLQTSIAQEYNLDTSTEVYWPLQPLSKPDYLQTVTDPVFDTKITRITGNVGDAIPNISGANWKNVARHGYNTRQPWNANESILYLQKQRTLGGAWGVPLFVDGETYEVIKRADNIPSANETRWHPSNPELMLLVNDESISTWNYYTEQVVTLMTFSGYSNVSMGYTGNFSTDATMIAVLANRNSDGKQVAFKLDFEQNIKYGDLDLSNSNFDIDFVTVSALGTYIVVNGDFGGGIDRTRIYNAETLEQVGAEWTEYGRPSHYDTTVDENGDEVVVGTSKSQPDAGRMIKRRMSDGQVTVLTPGGFSGHASARSLQRPGWVVTQTSSSTSWLPYLNEIIAVKLDGSRVERICNFRKEFLNYYNEAQPAVSPSGSRVIFASDWKSGNVPIQGYVVDYRDKLITSNQVNANAGQDQNICDGSSATLSANGGDTYLWSTGETTQSIIVTPNTTTTYTVTAFAGGESDIDDVIVNVNAIPIANAGSDVTISGGESTTLTALGGDTYLWNTGETTASITVTPNATTTYTVIAILNGCEDSDDVIVNVETTEVIANAGADVGICEGDSVTLTATGGTDYLWSTGETTQIIEVSPNSTTNYTVIVSNDNSSDTDNVTVEVNPVPIVTTSDDATILEGNYVTLSAFGANNYEWSNGATQPNIAVSPNITTTYAVTGYINDCYDVKNVTVNVVEQVVVEVGEDTSMCLGDEITLTANGSGADEYFWNTGATTQSITVSPEEDTLFTVMASNELDSDADEIMVTVATCEEEIIPEDIEFTVKTYIDSRISDDILNVKLTGMKNQCALYLFDISGKLIHTDEFDGNDGQEVIRTINTSLISDGIYVIKVMDQNNDQSKSILIR